MRIASSSSPLSRRRGVRCIASAVLVVTILAASVSLAPSAVADSADSLRTGVMAVRAASSCGPLRSDPIVEQVADNVNQSTDSWMEFQGRAVPVPEPLPVLKDLGYGGNSATAVYGTGRVDADAIKGLLLQGYAKIPDCRYTDYGVSVMQNQRTALFIIVLVLAGA
jgi:hypothetical protein